MSFEESTYQLRRDKLKQIEALGQESYPHKFAFTHTIPAILEKFSEASGEELERDRVNVRVAGRLMSIRGQGKAGFAHLQQLGKRLQIYVKLDFVGEKGFQLYKLLDLGDFIGVSGYLFRTKTKELSVHVEEITFLAKDLLPLPEKYHGLSDVELRYRQRYVDLTMNPEVRDVFVAQQGGEGHSILSRRARLHRSRDADDAAHRGRRCSASVHYAPQYARHRSLSAHRT